MTSLRLIQGGSEGVKGRQIRVRGCLEGDEDGWEQMSEVWLHVPDKYPGETTDYATYWVIRCCLLHFGHDIFAPYP